MVRGKGHGPKFDVEQCAFSPRFTHLVTFTPRIARIRPAVYAQAVRNDASITCWYQRQASPEAGHWRNTDPWTASLFSIWVVLAHHYSVFFGQQSQKASNGLHHSAVTFNQRAVIPLHTHPMIMIETHPDFTAEQNTAKGQRRLHITLSYHSLESSS